jgi:hypothetical protein
MQIVFTKHAKDRLKKRKITEEEIIEVIKFPEKLMKKKELYYTQKNIQRANIEVVFEKDRYIEHCVICST